MSKVSGFIGIILFALVWQVFAIMKIVDPLFLASPGQVVVAIVRELMIGSAFVNIALTLYRLGIGFIIGAVIGISLGLPIGFYTRLNQYLSTLIDFFRSVPVAALFPLFLIFFGIGDMSKIATAAWASSLIILVNTTYGVKNGNPTRRFVGRIHGMNRVQLFSKVVFPDAMPFIAAGLRTAISISLIVVVVTEMFLGTANGLGKEIYYSSMVYSTVKMYAYIVITGVVGYALNVLVIYSERKLIHWSGK